MGKEIQLRFVKEMNGRDLDFLISEDESPVMLVECKKRRKLVNPALRYLKKKFPAADAWQVSLDLKDDVIDKSGIRHFGAEVLLNKLV